jgi:penicillin-binding protein 1A
MLGSACRLIEVPTDEEIQIPELSQTSLLYDSQGKVIRSFYNIENRTLIPLSDVPVIVRNAVIAIEDQRFYSHRGLDVRALIRAAYANVKSGQIVQGGSTITEQLVKQTITGADRTLDRKVREAVIAYRLEETHSKDWILEQYLNTIYFGQGAYGIQAAARTYFARPASQLTLGQGALLAGLIRSPATYDPVLKPDAAVDRRNVVLQRMHALRFIDDQTYRNAIDNPLSLKESAPLRYPAPYFVQEVVAWFVDPANTDLSMFGTTEAERYNSLYTGGLRIYTTVDLHLQALAEAAVQKVLTERTDPHAAMTVIDPRSGAVRAMVGGRDFFAPRKDDPFSKLNLATVGVDRGGTGRHAGSAFKPFTLVAALENGISPSQVYPAPPEIEIPLPEDCQGPEDEPMWPVQNYEGEAGGKPTVEEATVLSLNVVYAQIVQDLGHDDPCAGAAKVVDAASRMGITSYLRAVPSATLGTNEVNTYEMASAYGTFATMGMRVPPMVVTRITEAAGKELFTHASKRTQAVVPGVAWTAVKILEGVITSGTGHAADIGRPAAGKTGTAQQWRDAWFVGFIPQMVAAVWVGFPEGEIDMVAPTTRLPHVFGGSWPATIWHDFMAKATADMPVVEFVEPGDIEYVEIAIDVERGCLPNAFTFPGDIEIVKFVKGTEPTEKCDDSARFVTVPAVVGFSRDHAIGVLQSYGFDVSVATRETNEAPANTVVGQSPGAGAQAFQGSTVTITVATPRPEPEQIQVPNVVGIQRADAVDTLKAAGLGVVVVDRWQCRPPDSCGAEDEQVWDQDPGAGKLVDPGSTVTIWANKTKGGQDGDGDDDGPVGSPFGWPDPSGPLANLPESRRDGT